MGVKYNLDERRLIEGELVAFFAEALDRPRLTSGQVSAISGVGAARISQWIARGQLKTDHVPDGTGHPRLFSIAEMGRVIALQVLVDAGVPIDVAITASASVSHNFRAHFTHLARKIQAGANVSDADLSEINLDCSCINLDGSQISYGFHDSVPFGEVLADMSESFVVINTKKVFGRVLVPHVGKILKLIFMDLDAMAKASGIKGESA